MVISSKIVLGIMAVVLVVAAVGVISEFALNGTSVRAVISAIIWFSFVGWWIHDFVKVKNNSKNDSEKQ